MLPNNVGAIVESYGIRYLRVWDGWITEDYPTPRNWEGGDFTVISWGLVIEPKHKYAVVLSSQNVIYVKVGKIWRNVETGKGVYWDEILNPVVQHEGVPNPQSQQKQL